jgi:hypothetical protein
MFFSLPKSVCLKHLRTKFDVASLFNLKTNESQTRVSLKEMFKVTQPILSENLTFQSMLVRNKGIRGKGYGHLNRVYKMSKMFSFKGSRRSSRDNAGD